MVDWVTLVVPFAYLSVLIGSLATFSSLYRKRKASMSAQTPNIRTLYTHLLAYAITTLVPGQHIS